MEEDASGNISVMSEITKIDTDEIRLYVSHSVCSSLLFLKRKLAKTSHGAYNCMSQRIIQH